MVHVLNSHPEICVGMERYKYPFTREKVVQHEFFAFDRFFDFRDSDTNLLPKLDPVAAKLYEAMKPKYPSATVVGDKVPHLLHLIRPLRKAFPASRFIYLLRDVNEVASSWHSRAMNPKDRWPVENDYRKAVEMWNTMNAGALALVKDGLPMLVVNYNSFFWGDKGERLLRFLEVESHPEFSDGYRAASDQYVSGRSRPAAPPADGQREYAGRNADYATYELLLKLSD